MAGHTGQSSQLFLVTTLRNAQFLATIQIGLNVSHVCQGSGSGRLFSIRARPTMPFRYVTN
jgi:hypothetical protein